MAYFRLIHEFQIMTILTRKNILLGGVLIVLLLLPPITEVFEQTYFISLFTRMLIYAIAAVSLDLILGYGGMVSFGHAAFFGIGGYAAGIFAFHLTEDLPILSWPFTWLGTNEALLSWPLAILTAAAAAVIIGWVSLRTTGVYFIMITLAFAQMLYFFFVSLTPYGGQDGMSLYERNTLLGASLDSDFDFYYVCLFALLAFIYFCQRLANSRFGRVIQGCKQNERRMQALGFATFRYKLVGFAIAGAGAGLAGVLLVNQIGYVSPDMLHWRQSGELMIMVILGGIGTLTGPALGAFALLALEEVLSAYTEHWQVILGPLLIVVVLFAKRGLYGIFLEGRR